MCYLEFGSDEVAVVDVTFLSGETPKGVMNGPSPELAADKVRFGTEPDPALVRSGVDPNGLAAQPSGAVSIRPIPGTTRSTPRPGGIP